MKKQTKADTNIQEERELNDLLECSGTSVFNIESIECPECKELIDISQIVSDIKLKCLAEFKKIIEELGEIRNKDNSLSTITLKDFSTNSVEFLKDKLKQKLQEMEK